MKTFTIYSKHGCKWCIKAEELLKERGYNYRVLYIDQPEHWSTVNFVEFREIFPDAKTVPQITMFETIGGYEDLVKALPE